MPRKVTSRRKRKAAAAQKVVAKVAQKNQPVKQPADNLENRVVIDENVARHLKPPPPSDVDIIISKDKRAEKKAAKNKDAHELQSPTPENTRNTKDLEYALDKDNEICSSPDLSSIGDDELLKQICKDLNIEVTSSEDEELANDAVPTETVLDCSTSPNLCRDPEPVAPNFFGNTGFFMLSGTDSQLTQHVKDLESKNIAMETYVELPSDVADIVEQQLAALVLNRNAILEGMRNKYDLLAQRRVPRQKTQRKYPKKTLN